MLIPPRKPKHARIPLISLIDMSFLLLVFFILITHFATNEQIELNTLTPKAKALIDPEPRDTSAVPGAVIVRLQPYGAHVGMHLVPYQYLRGAIAPYVPARAVVIETGEQSSVQQLLQALDAAKLAGATDITLQGIEN